MHLNVIAGHVSLRVLLGREKLHQAPDVTLYIPPKHLHWLEGPKNCIFHLSHCKERQREPLPGHGWNKAGALPCCALSLLGTSLHINDSGYYL